LTVARIGGAGPQFEDINGANAISYSVGAAWGDYDGDGYPDLFLSGGVLFRNNGDLTLPNVSAAQGLPGVSSGHDGVAGADYNNDGALDFFVAGDTSGADQLFRNDSPGFTNVAGGAGLTYGGTGRTASWGDYDRDGWLDLAVGYLGTVQLFHNKADGTFSNASGIVSGGSGGGTCAWADVDNDGWADLLSVGSGGAVVFHNAGGTALQAVPSAFSPAPSKPGPIAVADYDNDGWLDVAFSAPGGSGHRLLLYRNSRDGTFTDATVTSGVSGPATYIDAVSWADYDNDGWVDLYGASVGGPLLLYHNNGNGTFTESTEGSGLGDPFHTEASAWGDMDLDGRIDLFQAAEPTPRLYHNIGSAASWLRVRALTDRDGDATDANQAEDRDAIGARVDVNVDNDATFPPGRTIARVVGGGYGFLGQDEPIAQFGVPMAGPVAVRVIFPDGSVVVQKDVVVDQQIAVRDVLGGGDAPFVDVMPYFWAYAAIKACADAGIVQGYWDFTYRPSEPVSRGQMAVYISRALADGDGNVPAGPPSPSFRDVPTDYWAYKYVEYAKEHDVVQGYWDGYRPAELVDRGQMAVYISRAVAGGDAGVPDPGDSPTFPDVPADFWAYKYVEYCQGVGIVNGYPDGHYRPEYIVTRDQMAVYVARAFGLQ
jgi:hypothetical protein